VISLKKLLRKISIIIISICFITGCKSKDTTIKPVRKYMEAFGTMITFTMYDSKEINKVFPKLENYLENLYFLLDREHLYDNLNNLATINQNYGNGQEIVVDSLLIEALELSVELMKLTDGYFNIGIGALADTYKYYYYYDENNRWTEAERFSSFGIVQDDPSEEQIEEALSCTPTIDDLDNMLIINKESNSVIFNKISTCTDKIVSLSMGAIGKGFAVEKARNYVSTLTDKVFFINAGSSSMVTKGINPIKDRDTWNIDIQAPYPYSNFLSSDYSYQVGIKGDLAISTSGDTEQFYFISSGKDENDKDIIVKDEYGIELKRHHIINPKSGKPENYWNVITFISSSRADILDALTTASYSISSIEEIQTLISKIENRYNITIDYALQRAKTDKNENLYVSSYISESLQDKLLWFKDYLVIENKKEVDINE